MRVWSCRFANASTIIYGSLLPRRPADAFSRQRVQDNGLLCWLLRWSLVQLVVLRRCLVSSVQWRMLLPRGNRRRVNSGSCRRSTGIRARLRRCNYPGIASTLTILLLASGAAFIIFCSSLVAIVVSENKTHKTIIGVLRCCCSSRCLRCRRVS
jgi:hypothetical protein